MRNMAPRASSKRPPASTHTSSRRSYVDQVEPAEVKRSRRAAILQLKMGRLAHTIGIASGLALALTAVIAYGLVNWEFLRNAPGFVEQLKWMIPLVAGVVVAIVAIAVKWEPYLADKEEPHFVASVVGLVVSSLFIALILLDETDFLLFGSPDWLYPVSLLGISITLISLAMTWEGSSSRKTISMAAAVFPPILLTFPMVYHPDPEVLASILPMAYLGSAVAVQLSGSMLHIIASSTSVQQREVLKASDSKLKEQLVELDRKRQAIAYREEAFRARESELEAYEKKLSDEMASLEEQKQQITSLEAEVEQRLQSARDARQTAAKQEASIESERASLQLRQADIEAQRRELEKLAKSLSTREASVAARDREANRLVLEAQTKEREIKNRLAEVSAEEAGLSNTKKKLEDLQAALAAREKQIDVRESSLDMKGLEVASAREQLGKVAAEKTTVKNLEQQLLMRQESLSEKEIALRVLEADVQKKVERAERLSTRADQQLNELVDKESALLTKEKSLADKEAELKADLQGLTSRLEEMDRARATVSDWEKQYQDLTVTTKTKLSALSTREEDVSRKMNALEKRENKIKEIEQVLKSERDRINSKLRELLEKEKDLKAAETELGLRHAELKAMERDILEQVEEVEEVRAGVLPEEDERAKTIELRERRLMEREQEMKSRLYQREKELEKKELSLRAQLNKDLEEMEEAVEEEFAEKKAKSGIERLDDLLLGGMPFGSNILYVGPPFIGKEVAMLLFLAEGLKKGIPAVIVTTSHPPVEIAREMAPILPTFMEFEQLGLVRWVDASGLQAEDTGAKSTMSNVIQVAGSSDFEGITKALETCTKQIEKQKQPYFRLAFMSLSMSVTHADEKAALMFVQSITGRVKQAGAISLYAIERGMHTEQQLEALQHYMTGAIQFKTDKQKTLLSVQGVGEIQTREWIEYKHTNKALIVGAFSLERIR